MRPRTRVLSGAIGIALCGVPALVAWALVRGSWTGDGIAIVAAVAGLALVAGSILVVAMLLALAVGGAGE